MLTLEQWVLRADAGTLFAGSHGGLPGGRGNRRKTLGALYSLAQGIPLNPGSGSHV